MSTQTGLCLVRPAASATWLATVLDPTAMRRAAETLSGGARPRQSAFGQANILALTPSVLA